MEIGKSFTLTKEELALLLLGKVGPLEEACVGVCFVSLLSPSLTACLIWAIHLLPVNNTCMHTRTCFGMHVYAHAHTQDLTMVLVIMVFSRNFW